MDNNNINLDSGYDLGEINKNITAIELFEYLCNNTNEWKCIYTVSYFNVCFKYMFYNDSKKKFLLFSDLSYKVKSNRDHFVYIRRETELINMIKKLKMEGYKKIGNFNI